MRKLFMIIVVITTLGFIGCNQPNQEASTSADSTQVDSTAVDSTDIIYIDSIKE